MHTKIFPALAAAYCVINHSSVFGPQIPTLSPLPTPSDRNPAANWSTCFRESVTQMSSTNQVLHSDLIYTSAFLCAVLSHANVTPNLSLLHPNLSLLHPNLSLLHPNMAMLHPNLSLLHTNLFLLHPNLSLLTLLCSSTKGEFQYQCCTPHR